MDVQAGQVWEHFKGQMFTVTFVGVATQDYRERQIYSTPEGDREGDFFAESNIPIGATIVLYQRCNGSDLYGRSLENFLGNIDPRPRFTLVGEP